MRKISVLTMLLTLTATVIAQKSESPTPSPTVPTDASKQSPSLIDWLKSGRLEIIQQQLGPKREPVWTPEVFGTPCNTTSSCGPGIGPKPPIANPKPSPKPPTPSPCGDVASCGPGVGSIGGVIQKEDLKAVEAILHELKVKSPARAKQK